MSTEDYQDPVTSRARQVGQAEALVAGHGQIVAHFFDSGLSRTLAWARRPQAAAPRRPARPHLAALAILHADQGQAAARTGIAGVTAPDRTAKLIDHLRAAGVTLIYDPGKRTLRTDTDDSVAVTIGRDR